MEFFCACEAAELRGDRLAPVLQRVSGWVRDYVAPLVEDRVLSVDTERLADALSGLGGNPIPGEPE